MSDKVGSVEGIRGVACFMVVLSHLSLTFFPYLQGFIGKAGANNPIQSFIHNSPFGFIYSGTSAVYIFFVLSGYILTYVALKNNVNKLISMSLKRYPRLMIPAVVSCVFAYLIFTFLHIDKSMLTDWINKYGDFNYSLIGSIYSGTIESFLFGYSPYNPVLWTMQIELIGSLVVFAMCYIRYNSSSFLITIGFIIFLLALTGVKIISAKLGLGLIAFVAGHLFYLYGKNISFMLSMLLFVTGLYLAGTHNQSSSYSLITSIFGSKSYILGNFISGIIIVYSIIFSNVLSALFSKKIFVFMGKVSFSVYLIHLPIISSLGVLFFSYFIKYFNYDMSAFLSSISVIFLTYAIAVFYFRYVDQPGMVLSNQFSKNVSKLIKLQTNS